MRMPHVARKTNDSTDLSALDFINSFLKLSIDVVESDKRSATGNCCLLAFI